VAVSICPPVNTLRVTIGGHLLNLLSSVVIPPYMLDYFDEDESVMRGTGGDATQ